MLYADDTMLLLGDTFHTLKAAMHTITKFGELSGLLINWEKSALMLLDSKFKYLGNQITPQLVDFCHLNITPLLSRFRDKI